MPQGIKGWTIFAFANFVITVVIRFAIKLVDNAMLTWVDNRIARVFGLSEQPSSTKISWIVIAFIVFVMLLFYHKIQSSWTSGYPSSNYVNLSRLNNTDLQKRAIIHADKMRAFEAKRKRKQAASLINRNYRGGGAVAWRTQTAADFRESAKAQNEFRRRFLPEALALERAIAHRLGRQVDNDTRPCALRYGMLAGPSPISDAADYIEAMAREL